MYFEVKQHGAFAHHVSEFIYLNKYIVIQTNTRFAKLLLC